MPTGIYSIILAIYSIVFLGLFPSITLILVSCLTLRNRRQFHRRMQAMRNNTNQTMQQRERDLSVLVIFEVVFYLICTALFPLIQMEMIINQYAIGNTSFEHFQIEIFTFQISVSLLCVYSAGPFYVYLFATKSFRRDFVKLITEIFQKTSRIRPMITNTVQQNTRV